MNAELLLEMRGIGKSFPGVRALDQVDFELRSGEVHVLLGENGAGKSTLMKILSGATRLDEGEIRVAGREVAIGNPNDAQGLGISTIYQEFNLIPHLPVSANIFLGREPCWLPGVVDRVAILEKTREILSQLGIAIDPSAWVNSLSVAEQQMVEVAKALAFDARILIMDEPTSALTANEIRTLFELIRKVRNQGVGVIYISHRMEEIFEIGDRVTVLRDGKYIATRNIADVAVDELIRLMADRELTEHFPRRPVTPGPPVLEVEGLSTTAKLKNVSLVLRRGEILGIAGLLGSGRTELARAIFGADRIESGHIRVHQTIQRIHSPRAAIHHGIGFLPEDRKQHGLVLQMSVKRNVTLPNTDKVYPHGLLDAARERNLTNQCVRDFRIKTPHIDQAVVNLSGGNQQKVVLGKWVAREADILIFDEPTRGIDVGAKVEIYQLMNRLTAKGGAILMISSELPEILGMSDRILVMYDGWIVAEFTRQEATQQKLLRAALGGDA